MSDEEILRTASKHNKIAVTLDKDFGHLAQAHNPPGIPLLRLKLPEYPIDWKQYYVPYNPGERLYSYITIVTETRTRRKPVKHQP